MLRTATRMRGLLGTHPPLGSIARSRLPTLRPATPLAFPLPNDTPALARQKTTVAADQLDSAHKAETALVDKDDDATSAAVREQIRRAGMMMERVGQESSSVSKKAVVTEFPDLKELLKYVLDTQGVSNFDVTVAGFEKYLQTDAYAKRTRQRKKAKPMPNLLSLFRALSERQLTGHSARAAVAQFLLHHGIMENEKDLQNPDYIVFGRLLTRRLNCGLGYALLSQIKWNSGADQSRSARAKAKARAAGSSRGAQKPEPESLPEGEDGGVYLDRISREELPIVGGPKPFSVALGQSTEPPFTKIFDGGEWYVSRKLDGVRCITYLDFLVPRAGEPWLVDVRFRSRSGKDFTSLENLGKDIRDNIRGFPGLRELVLSDSAVVANDGRRRLVLDGEVCVMRPLTKDEAVKVDHGTAGPLWEDNGLTEDFRATVSQVKKKYDAVRFPAYFLFDVLLWSDFAGASTAERQNFVDRQRHVQELGNWLSRDQEKRGLVRPLLQRRIESPEQLGEMVERAAREGWEGLVLRKDTKYKGSRSSDVLKYKQWQDAEYEVVDIETSVQRLSVNGAYGEYEALAAVIIEHKGHRVAVGSGFTTMQRLQFRRRENIVGKTMTVEYFGESEVPGREGKSLRFPRVKALYEGAREV
ncbi:uncharacterized protein CcaverHIS019_0700130 [Cutaneotrichosporon cavernicola]|uniref:ATP-dependent DNA ligase family profile domain-containing protein n=1 Tax=Cutaneotrichosporon cavernicola TaxID=279322 RepID=A0AA48QYI8_9TREE|nr:uncharacterized protein CcaverHIS019_0700130 [Cutaneotrichosporon cavernicola]BEI94441.1 hypothetical protein CcaverHIS019_0700130 [Cutaneotrichosporon cavernicola]BEJ02218.1 hypothetical protein CcaverHIS631_0700130 [Cutaneotrichosporon cavernicola]BEJ09978.1 hypothetical protein CcaverHIS641_0700130 [Cutaneotrichosporon cavernicola]